MGGLPVRDLSISYNQLGDLARASGQAHEAERLYRQSLTIPARLAQAEPGNTEYARDLSISYERLGSMDLDEGRTLEAVGWFQRATTVRRRIFEQESFRVDLAEELGVAIVLLAQAVQNAVDAAQELIAMLTPFEQDGALTSKGIALLRWAREVPS
ncbi:tetratricopeptide repeat protein [Streptomyces sp. NPDC002962]|uniref:tetratricopeptide repeat protein n=1 Tax=Streptomyces sp. NPDC002962 TaxID=3364674 RepID=UPI0036963802